MKQLVSLLALVVFLVGCNTVSPEAAAYKSIGVIATTVDASMLGWGDYVKAGLAKPNEEAKVKEVYQKYQASMLVAKVGVLTYVDNKEQKDSSDCVDDYLSSCLTTRYHD